MIGVHVVVGAYGFWLPNDPRGSWSTFVGSAELFRYGRATKVTTNRSLAGRRHDVAARLAAKQALLRPAVKFDGMQARAIGRGFAACAEKSGLRIWACAILPDHWHLVVGAHRLAPKQLAIQLKGAATRRLLAEGIYPFGSMAEGRRIAKCFARGEWSGFLNNEDEVRRAIRYVEGNPAKEGLRRQRWRFVTEFKGA